MGFSGIRGSVDSGSDLPVTALSACDAGNTGHHQKTEQLRYDAQLEGETKNCKEGFPGARQQCSHDPHSSQVSRHQITRHITSVLYQKTDFESIGLLKILSLAISE